MTPAEVVRARWERMEARDGYGSRATLADGHHVFHCLSFAVVEEGLIARSIDHSVDDRGDPAPDWRAPFRVPQEPD
ncbi:MAG TPA: hypothetical protein VFB77_04500 [Acidimicrobiales bacterium]|nr:hypothetical protein [Acidimicrobiales bacterium]